MNTFRGVQGVCFTIVKSPAFQFYPDEFIGGTCDLSAAEVGAYIRLLCYQWGRGSIPSDDPDKIARIAGAVVSPDVLAKFINGKNPRMEKTRTALENYRTAQANNGARGAEKRWGGHNLANGVAIISPMARNSSQSPTSDSISILQEPIPAAEPPEHAIYALYPRKVGKTAALKAIRNCLRSVAPSLLLERTKAYADAMALWPDSDRQFIPHPATWYNRGSYEDDPKTWQRTGPDAKRNDRSFSQRNDYSLVKNIH